MASDSDDGLPEHEEELSAEEEPGSDEEEERGSSAEEGSDEDEDEEEEEDGSDDDESPTARRPKKKHRAFVIPPPRALPQRTTRGDRMGQVAADEGDEEFWNQEFFAEEAADERYETESEPEDRFDADFMESEDEGDEDEAAAEAEAEAKEPKRKTLKPPGYKKPPLARPKPKPEPIAAATASGEADEGAAAGGTAAAGTPGSGGSKRKVGRPSKAQQKELRGSLGPDDFSVGRRTVRESTRQKVEEGEMERKMAEKYKPRRPPQRSAHYRPLTQSELLAEAAKTEIENTKSLQFLLAIEEESRQRAHVQKKRYAGPMVRWKSRRVGEVEMTTLEVRNMAMPDEMRQQLAPLPPLHMPCAVTGQPAKYRDPHTGLPYANLEAYRELKRRREAGLIPTVVNPTAAAAGAAGVMGGALGGLGGLPGQQSTAAAAAAAATGDGVLPVRQSSRHAAAATTVQFQPGFDWQLNSNQPQQQQPQFQEQQQPFVAVPPPLFQADLLMQQQQPLMAPEQQQQQQQLLFPPLMPQAYP